MPRQPRPVDFSVPPGSHHKLVELERFEINEKAALAQLKNANVRLRKNQTHKWVDRMTLGKLSDPRKSLESVLDLKKLHYLTFEHVDAKVAQQFAGHSAIRGVTLNCEVSPEVLQIFASTLPNLVQLKFSCENFSDDCGKALSCAESLQVLTISNIRESAAGFTQMADSKIYRLDLNKCNVDKTDCFEAISKMEYLVALTADGCSFSPGVISPLSRLKTLRYLSMQESNVTDDDIRSLGSLPLLSTLDLQGTSVSKVSAEVITENFPELYSLESNVAGLDRDILQRHR